MARPGRTESASVPIWLKLSEADAAQLEQVLARPEFAGWTRAEWCLEIIQTALRYYARRPAAGPGQERAAQPGQERLAARPAEAEPAPEPPRAAPETAPPTPKPRRAAPRPRRTAPKSKPAASETQRPAPAPERAAPATGRAAPEPQAGPPEPLDLTECSHPAEARDYQTGTCASCGAILWD
jgi:hypothetical protein